MTVDTDGVNVEPKEAEKMSEKSYTWLLWLQHVPIR